MEGFLTFYSPLIFTIVCIMINAIVGSKGIIWASFLTTIAYSIFLIIIWPFYSLKVICLFTTVLLWALSFGVYAMRSRYI